jgi:predicted O-methyltransferase YrrM
MVGLLEGQFLGLLVRLTGAKRILEVGTFTGYSSISMALALPDDGRVITCDVNAETTEVARRYAAEAGVVDRIEYRIGPGLDSIAALEGEFDLIFIDADKPNYLNYYEATLPKLAADGLMILDNTLWSGRVANPAEDDENTRHIRAFNDWLAADARVDCVMLGVGDGLTVARKR